MDTSHAFLDRLTRDAEERIRIFGGPPADLNFAEGIRAIMPDGVILQLRPSGNAPEFRIYAEADTAPAAHDAMAQLRARVAETLLSDGDDGDPA